MKGRTRTAGLLALMLCCCLAEYLAAATTPRIQVIARDVAPRVDVLAGGRPLAEYVYLHSMTRPSLQAVRSSIGAVVTRDALWFGHPDTNGIDFSGGSGHPGRAGRIVHRRVVETVSSDDEGQLGLEMSWIGANDALTLVEETRFTFRDRDRVRTIDRATRLDAVRGPVHLAPCARGFVGVALAEPLTRRAAVLASEGRIEGSAVPGARRPWVAVATFARSQPVTIALMDHPQNPGFPNAWRVDASGLLEIVPIADVNIDESRSIRFRHRLVIWSGHVDGTIIEKDFEDFSGQGR